LRRWNRSPAILALLDLKSSQLTGPRGLAPRNEERAATRRVRLVARVPSIAVERQCDGKVNGKVKWSRPMRFHLPCGVLALAIGASTAQAQTVITGPAVGQPVGTVVAPGPLVTAPAAAVVQPAETIQTVQTIRTVRAAPLPPVRRQVVTTRTITRHVIPAAPAVVAGTVAAAPAPLYDTAVPAAVPAPAYDYADTADYGAPLYDAAPAAVVAPAPVVAAPVAMAPVIYRYVYEPDRILVIDPTTNIAVQAIPR
jgi:hypothetical protein